MKFPDTIPAPQRMNPLDFKEPMISPLVPPLEQTTFLAQCESIQSLQSVGTLPCAPPVFVITVGL